MADDDSSTPPTSPPSPGAAPSRPLRSPDDAVDAARTWPGRGRRAIVCGALCLAGAAPSFALAESSDFSLLGLVLGVITFAALMTLVSWSRTFQRFSRGHFVRRTLGVVYTGRIILSIGGPAFFIVDALSGLLVIGTMTTILSTIGLDFALDRTGNAAPGDPWGTLGNAALTYIAVLLQGTALNVVVGVGFLLIWIPQLLFLEKPPRPEGTNICGRCGYCLDGTPPDAPCPECGSTEPARTGRNSFVDRLPLWKLVTGGTAIVALTTASATFLGYMIA